MNSLLVKSPAKLNLHLRILGKRRDGYHDLLTVFHRISLADSIRIKKVKKGFMLATDHPGLETGEGNLITKAYRALQLKFPGLGGVSVRVAKRIPLGAGLGGGSSNAAHFLLGMKRLFQLRVSRKELLGIGKRLGADVPFFLLDAPQVMAWGIGEKMKRLPRKTKLWFLLLVTEQGLNTKKVYQGLRTGRRPLSLTKEKGVAIILRNFFNTKRIREAARLARNDLELSAFKLRPAIPQAIKTLKALGAPFVLMSGSGPTVFAVFSSRKEAKEIFPKISGLPVSYRKLICHSF